MRGSASWGGIRAAGMWGMLRWRSTPCPDRAYTRPCVARAWWPREAPRARRFITERHEEAWLRAVRVAEEFYRENCSHGAFWRDTAAAYAALLPAAAPPRQAAEAARIERRPVLDRGRILEREVIITANHPRGVWHIGGVPLASLKHYFDAAEHATIDGAALALDRPPAAIATAIHWLQQVGHMLRPQPSVSSGG